MFRCPDFICDCGNEAQLSVWLVIERLPAAGSIPELAMCCCAFDKRLLFDYFLFVLCSPPACSSQPTNPILTKDLPSKPQTVAL